MRRRFSTLTGPLLLIAGLGCSGPSGEEGRGASPAGEEGREATPDELVEGALSALAAGRHAFAVVESEGGEVVREGRLLVAAAGAGEERYLLTWEGEPPVRVATDGETAFAGRPGGDVLVSSLTRAGRILLGREAGPLVPAALDPSSFTRYPTESLPAAGGLRGLRAPLPGGGGWELAVGADGLPRRVAFRGSAEQPPSVLELEPIEGEVPAEPAAYRLEPAAGGRRIEFFAGPAPGDPAPEVTFELVDGSAVALGELRGSAVVLDFWATWCVPCRPAMRELEELWQELGDEGLRVYGLRLWDSGDPAEFLASVGVSYPLGAGGPLAGPLAIDEYGLPALYVIGRDGRIVDLLVGFDAEASPPALRRAVLAALEAG